MRRHASTDCDGGLVVGIPGVSMTVRRHHQHDWLQTRRPSGHVVGCPPLHATLQLPTLVHVTEHAPLHVTSQSPTLVHSAEPPFPSPTTHLLVLSQVYTQPAPHWPPQLVTPEHWILHWSAHPTEQSVLCVQEKLQPVWQNASHVSAPAHVGVQPGWSRQSSVHEP
jgi:hypothetical protein